MYGGCSAGMAFALPARPFRSLRTATGCAASNALAGLAGAARRNNHQFLIVCACPAGRHRASCPSFGRDSILGRRRSPDHDVQIDRTMDAAGAAGAGMETDRTVVREILRRPRL